MIYVFGDSHVNFFTHSHPSATNSKYGNFISYCVGPGTAYHFFKNRYEKMIEILKKHELTNNDYVLICAGEIDCRIHIPKKHLKENTPIDILIEKSIDKLLQCYLNLIDLNIKCIGWGHQPSLELKNRGDDGDGFAYGNQYLRNSINIEWDTQLQHKCQIHEIPYISILYDLLNNDNTVKSEFYTDDCHLSSVLLWDIMNQKFQYKGLVKCQP